MDDVATPSPQDGEMGAATSVVVTGAGQIGQHNVQHNHFTVAELQLASATPAQQVSDAAEYRRFARHMAGRVKAINDRHEWGDNRFADLEAEVEFHGRRSGRRWGRGDDETTERVPSLTSALRERRDQIVLLQGEPGSGKSVALRRVAVDMAEDAAQETSRRSEFGWLPGRRGRPEIPLYVELKDFRPTGPVTAAAVREFVLTSLGASGERTSQFLARELDRGRDERAWVFLFDSFDEIPAILGQVEANAIIDEYATAIADFVGDMSECRAVIASRDYRGPHRLSWPRYEVLRLTPERQHDLVHLLRLPAARESLLLDGLETADAGIRLLSANPMFLALLGDFVAEHGTFPRTSHEVFESYVSERLARDTDRLAGVRVTSAEARLVAERVAYAMSAQPDLGLSPPTPLLLDTIHDPNRSGSLAEIDRILAALEALQLIGLARRPDAQLDQGGTFSFVHRRFQEYFATCEVLRQPSQVAPAALLLDGHWRETAVTLFQTQSDTDVSPLLDEAERLIQSMAPGVELEKDPLIPEFGWPTNSLHLLSLLQAAFGNDDERLPLAIREPAGQLLTAAAERGGRRDAVWATDLCLTATPETAHALLLQAFDSGSPLIRDVAFSQTARLPAIPENLRDRLRRMLGELVAGGRLRRERGTIEAQLRRIPDSSDELRIVARLVGANQLDVVLWLVMAGIASTWGALHGSSPSQWALEVVAAGIGMLTTQAFNDALRPDIHSLRNSKLVRLYRAETNIFGVLDASVIFIPSATLRTVALLVLLPSSQYAGNILESISLIVVIIVEILAATLTPTASYLVVHGYELKLRGYLVAIYSFLRKPIRILFRMAMLSVGYFGAVAAAGGIGGIINSYFGLTPSTTQFLTGFAWAAATVAGVIWYGWRRLLADLVRALDVAVGETVFALRILPRLFSARALRNLVGLGVAAWPIKVILTEPDRAAKFADEHAVSWGLPLLAIGIANRVWRSHMAQKWDRVALREIAVDGAVHYGEFRVIDAFTRSNSTGRLLILLQFMHDHGLANRPEVQRGLSLAAAAGQYLSRDDAYRKEKGRFWPRVWISRPTTIARRIEHFRSGRPNAQAFPAKIARKLAERWGGGEASVIAGHLALLSREEASVFSDEQVQDQLARMLINEESTEPR